MSCCRRRPQNKEGQPSDCVDKNEEGEDRAHSEAVSRSLGTPDAISFILPSVVMVFLPRGRSCGCSCEYVRKEDPKVHSQTLDLQSNMVTANTPHLLP